MQDLTVAGKARGIMRRPSVLIVDDDAFSRAVVSKRIAMLADVVDAEDGYDALAHMQSTVFDLAIVDLEMPNFNGFELIVPDSRMSPWTTMPT